MGCRRYIFGEDKTELRNSIRSDFDESIDFCVSRKKKIHCTKRLTRLYRQKAKSEDKEVASQQAWQFEDYRSIRIDNL